ncbi:MAG: hypothetical protein ACI9Y1_003123, partial [Lentisphaeria bacterium]
QRILCRIMSFVKCRPSKDIAATGKSSTQMGEF